MAFWGLFGGKPARGDEILIAFASQTGRAEKIAHRSAETLRAGGREVRVSPLGALDLDEIARAGKLLVIASTSGVGDPPDMARRFFRHRMVRPTSLKGLSYAVLALGNRDYDDFCAFGRKVEAWLKESGAKSLFPIIMVDSDRDPDALDKWRDQLLALNGVAGPGQWHADTGQAWRLVERRLLNPGSPGAQAWHLSLVPRDAALLAWSAGDIAVVAPEHDPTDIDRFIARNLLDGTRRVSLRGREVTLRAALIKSALPTDFSDPLWMEKLAPLPRREYSAASIPQSGHLDLLVRKTVREDGTLGLGSGWLLEHTGVGEEVMLFVRPNPSFRAPPTDGPMILIGAGTGFAGLRAHLQDRKHRGLKDAWLVFGERSLVADRFYGDEIEAWQADGTLARTDLIFSRQFVPRIYVQHFAARHTDEIRREVKQGASLLVCGGTAMAAGVHAVLADILGEEALDAMIDDGCYRRDVY